jgi:hypothetical protein
VAAAWTVRSHTLKAPRAARTARGGRIGDLREISKIHFFFFNFFNGLGYFKIHVGYVGLFLAI